MKRTLLLAALALPALASCVLRVGEGGVSFGLGHDSDDGIVVDGVRLEHEREETIEIGGFAPEGLTVANVGDVRVESGPGASGTSAITVVLHEKTPGDAYAVYEDGKLQVRTASGDPAAIGDVLVQAGGALPALRIETGMGDVELEGVEIAGKLEVSTGMGDVEVRDVACGGDVACSTGMGDMELSGSSFGNVTASSGMGDVDLAAVAAKNATFSTGAGDLGVRDSSFSRLDMSTGLGDIELDEQTTYTRHRFETGLGSVTRQ